MHIKDNKEVLRGSGCGQGWEAGQALNDWGQSDSRLLDSNTGCSETVGQCLQNSAENNFQPRIPFLAKYPIERTLRPVEWQMQTGKLIRSAGVGKKSLFKTIAWSVQVRVINGWVLGMGEIWWGPEYCPVLKHPWKADQWPEKTQYLLTVQQLAWMTNPDSTSEKQMETGSSIVMPQERLVTSECSSGRGIAQI